MWLQQSRSLFLIALFLATVTAGCVSNPAGEVDEDALVVDGQIQHDRIAEHIGAPVELQFHPNGDPMAPDHDHRDAESHRRSYNLDLVNWEPFDIQLGDNGFANFVFWQSEDGTEDLLAVAIDGDEFGGFLLVDAADPKELDVLGRYWINGDSIQEVRISPDGRFAAMNVQSIPEQGDVTGTTTDCPVCIHLVDISDRTQPTLASVHPVDLLGTHNLDFHVMDDTTYLFYVGQPLAPRNLPPANDIHIAQLVEPPAGPARLVDLGTYGHAEDYGQDQRSFPHDIIIQKHPITGQEVAYLSHWQGGAVTIDVTNPLAPTLLDVYEDPAPSALNNIHWFAPEPIARGGTQLIAYSAPEIGSLESGPGVIRSYDVTDPADIRQLDAWRLPGDMWIPDQYILSPHTTIPNMDKGLLAVTHYHAGVWLLDISDPSDLRHLAFHMPVPPADDERYDGDIWWKKPNFNPEGFLPNAYMARWKDDLLWVTERGTGLYVLDYTGPEPGRIK